MTAPASSARGPSDSPVTASVVKFRCLFTHDLRRKSKRWQDGYLRYHAFNKRVMVYDEQGNFIGDHHWRSGDEVQDGDELELDKGVLIEVGERMSTTQTDLTNLFEKRKSSQGSPSSNTHLSQAARTSTPVRSSGSSQPFRSLNDLLGIRKAPVGHLMSPYEERHHLSSSNTNTALSSGPDRPLKRQKVVVPQPTAINKKKSVSEVVDLTEPERIPSNSNQSRVGLVQEVRRPQESMPSMPPPEKPRKETVPKPHIPNKPGVAKSSSSLPSKPPADVPTKVPDRAPAKDPPSAKPAKGSPPSHHVQEIQDDDWEAPIKNMRVTMQKPRKKLMYSALLPGEKPQKPSPPPRISRAEKTNQPAPKAAATESPSLPPPEVDLTNAEYMPSDSTQFILEKMVDGSISQPESNQTTRPSKANLPLSSVHNLPTRRALDAPLRKSISDPTALNASSTLQGRPSLTPSALNTVVEDTGPDEEGPWTTEAQDLFDFWPAGRPKPDR